MVPLGILIIPYHLGLPVVTGDTQGDVGIHQILGCGLGVEELLELVEVGGVHLGEICCFKDAYMQGGRLDLSPGWAEQVAMEMV